MSSKEKQSSQRKPRRLQLRLRTMLGLLAVVSGVFGWVVFELEQRQNEKKAIAWVEGMSGSVGFKFTGSVGIPWGYKPERRIEVSWWDQIKDQLFGRRVVSVDLSNTAVSDLSPLADLKNIHLLKLHQTEVDDLTPLAGLENLQELDLSEASKLHDLAPLANLKNLNRLVLSHAPVRDLRPLAALRNLTDLELQETKVNDLTPLAGLENLDFLALG